MTAFEGVRGVTYRTAYRPPDRVRMQVESTMILKLPSLTKLEISLSRGDTDTLTVIDVVTENDVVKT